MGRHSNLDSESASNVLSKGRVVLQAATSPSAQIGTKILLGISGELMRHIAA
jgi:hypothetical protein